MRPELLQSRFEVDTLLIIAEERPPEYNRVGLNVTSMLSAFDETVRRRRSMFYTKAINHGERSTPCLEVASRPTLLKGEKSPPRQRAATITSLLQVALLHHPAVRWAATSYAHEGLRNITLPPFILNSTF